jgi:uncharacterized membrane protein YkvA (DUF1232 family)
MDGVMKLMMIIVVMVYVLSPVDAYPGPFDDFLVVMLALAARKNGVTG